MAKGDGRIGRSCTILDSLHNWILDSAHEFVLDVFVDWDVMTFTRYYKRDWVAEICLYVL